MRVHVQDCFSSELCFARWFGIAPERVCVGGVRATGNEIGNAAAIGSYRAVLGGNDENELCRQSGLVISSDHGMIFQ